VQVPDDDDGVIASEDSWRPSSARCAATVGHPGAWSEAAWQRVGRLVKISNERVERQMTRVNACRRQRTFLGWPGNAVSVARLRPGFAQAFQHSRWEWRCGGTAFQAPMMKHDGL